MTKLLFAFVLSVCVYVALSDDCRPAYYECVDNGKVVGTICRDTCFYREGHPCQPCEPYANWKKAYIGGCQSKFKNANITDWKFTERDCNRCACECDWENECGRKPEL